MAKTILESDQLKVLGKMLEKANKSSVATATTGACVYSAGTKTYCAVLTKSQCDKLSGAWTSGGKCS